MDQRLPQAPPKTSKRLLIIAAIWFFAVGLAQAAFGPALPDLAAQTHASLIAAGALVTANFGGVVCGQVIGGAVLKRVGQRNLLLAGMAGFILGLMVVIFATSLTSLLAGAALFGASCGAAVLAGNVLAAEASSGAGPLNLVNAMFGVGAIVSPSLVGAAMLTLKSGLPALWAAPIVAGLCIAVMLFELQAPKRNAPPPANGAAGGGAKAVIASPLVWAAGLFLLCDGGIEVTVGTWLAKLLEGALDIPLAYGAMAVSWFWLQFTIVRFIAAAVSRRIAPLTLLRACAVVSVLGGAALVASTVMAEPLLAGAGVTLLGYGIGPVFPTTLAVVRAAFPHEAGVATAVSVGTGNIGSALAPLLAGYLIAHQGAPAGSGLLLTAAVALSLLLVIVDVLFRLSRPVRPGRPRQVQANQRKPGPAAQGLGAITAPGLAERS